MKKMIPFNDWSKKRIAEGRKICTSRHQKYLHDPRVKVISKKLPWYAIRDTFWMAEGADSPEELQEVIENIYNRKVPDDEKFYVHFGDFREGKE